MTKNRKKLKYLFEFLLVVIIFLGISYLVQSNIEFFRANISDNFTGILVYVLFIQLAIVFAPLSAIPLVPVASAIFGPFTTGLINIFSWTLGSVIVFFICRKWGVELISRLISLDKIHKFESKIPEENEFWSVVFLRMVIPVDILSYALSLFSKINFRNYLLSTIIGITPFAILIGYLGIVPFIYQVFSLLVFGVVFLIWFIFKNIQKKYK